MNSLSHPVIKHTPEHGKSSRVQYSAGFAMLMNVLALAPCHQVIKPNLLQMQALHSCDALFFYILGSASGRFILPSRMSAWPVVGSGWCWNARHCRRDSAGPFKTSQNGVKRPRVRLRAWPAWRRWTVSTPVRNLFILRFFYNKNKKTNFKMIVLDIVEY